MLLGNVFLFPLPPYRQATSWFRKGLQSKSSSVIWYMRNLEESASCCRGRLAPAFVQSSCVQAPEMVLQTAVTPGRARRLLFKIPYGSLRRRSGERVSQLFLLLTACTPGTLTFQSDCVTLQHSAHCHNNPFIGISSITNVPDKERWDMVCKTASFACKLFSNAQSFKSLCNWDVFFLFFFIVFCTLR